MTIQGLLEARVELRPLLFGAQERLKDLIFLDIALDSTVRTAIERGYEELNSADPQVTYTLGSFQFLSIVTYLLTYDVLRVILFDLKNRLIFFVHVQKIMYFISLVVENLALSTDDNEDLIYCLKVVAHLISHVSSPF